VDHSNLAAEPATLLNPSVTRKENSILRISYMFNIDCSIAVVEATGKIVQSLRLSQEYYLRNLGVQENIIQSKTLGINAAELLPATYTVKVDLPLEALEFTLIVRP
jgi:hypothetical protein